MATVSDDIGRLSLQHQTCFALSVASREVVSLYRPVLEPLGLTHPQYLVLVALWEVEEPVSVKRLSSLLQYEAPTLSPMLKRLQKAGLVERQRDPADERSLQVSLTESGRELRTRVAEVPGQILERLGMDVEKLAALQDLLAEVIDHARLQNDAHRLAGKVGGDGTAR